MAVKADTIKPPSWKQLFAETWWLHPKYKYKTAFIADGSIRTGKTMWMSLGFVQWAMDQFNGFDFIMAGKTIMSLRRNVIKGLIKRLRGLGYVITDKKSENMLIITLGDVTNQFYLFGGKDEASQDLVQGLTAAGVYFDEVALMPESFVNQATGRALTVPCHKYWFNCNPGNPFHYFKTEWIDGRTKKNAIRLHFDMKDNPILSDKDIEDASNMYTGAFYERYILGNWVSADGLVYPNFNRDKMVVDSIPEGVQLTKSLISVDYGIYHPMVFEKWQLGTNRVWYCTDLYYFDGSKAQVQKDDQQYANDFDVFCRDVNPIAIVIDPSASSFIKALQMRGYYQIKKANNDVNNGIRLTQTRMDDGSIKFLNTTHMQPLFKELSTYSWNMKAAENGVDAVIKKFDHGCDSIRYMVNYALQIKPKTNGVQMFKNF